MFYSVATKRIFAFCTLLTLLFVLAGCSHTDDTVSDGTTTGTSTETSGSVETMGMSPVDTIVDSETPVVVADSSTESEPVSNDNIPASNDSPVISGNSNPAPADTGAGASSSSGVVDNSNSEPEAPVVEETPTSQEPVNEDPAPVAEATPDVTPSSSNNIPELATNTNPFKQVYSDLRRTEVGKVLTFPVMGSNIDTAAVISVTQQPAKGTLTVGGDQLTFTPDSGVSGYTVAKIKADWLDGTTDTATIQLYTEQVRSKTYYDPISGNDSNPGTQAQPKKTGIADAVKNASDGDRIYLKGGQTYDVDYVLRDVAGGAYAPVVLGSYGGSKATLSGGSIIRHYGSTGHFVLENINIAGTSDKDAVLIWNESGSTDVQHITYDNVEISGGRNGINNQGPAGSFKLLHSTIKENAHIGFLGGNNQDVVMLQNTFLRNADHKNYDGGPMLWNTYITKTSSFHYEGNHSEESEGLMKLRGTENFTIQKNTFKAGWIIGVSVGSEVKNNIPLSNGLFARNLIEESQNSITLGDADNYSGGVINNVVIRDNACVKGKNLGGFSRNSVLYAADDMTYNNVTVYDNIFWADGPGGQGGSRVDDYLEFYDNIIGGADFVTLQRFGAPPDTHGNQLYRIDAGASLGMDLTNGNTEITDVPQKVQDILDKL